jgi:hypothetical protein
MAQHIFESNKCHQAFSVDEIVRYPAKLSDIRSLFCDRSWFIKQTIWRWSGLCVRAHQSSSELPYCLYSILGVALKMIDCQGGQYGYFKETAFAYKEYWRRSGGLSV